MSAQTVFVVVGAHHHGHRIPAHQRTNASLHEQIARHGALVFGRDGIAEGGGNRAGQWHTGGLRVLGEVPQ